MKAKEMKMWVNRSESEVKIRGKKLWWRKRKMPSKWGKFDRTRRKNKRKNRNENASPN